MLLWILFTEYKSLSLSRGGDEVGSSRIDRSYHWGDFSVVESEYNAVAFLDFMAHIVLPCWEMIVKSGIKRSKEIQKMKTSRLNCLIMKQSFYKKEVQAGDFSCLGKLKEV